MPLIGGEESPGSFRPLKVDQDGRVYVIPDDQLGIFQVDGGGNIKVNVGIVYHEPREPATIALSDSTPEDSYELFSPMDPVRVVIVGFGDDEAFQMNFDDQDSYLTLPTSTVFTMDIVDVEAINFKMVNLPVTISVMEFVKKIVR